MLQLNNFLVLVPAALTAEELADVALVAKSNRQMDAILDFLPECDYAVQGSGYQGADRLNWYFARGQSVMNVVIRRTHLAAFLAVIDPVLTTYNIPKFDSADGWTVSRVVES